MKQFLNAALITAAVVFAGLLVFMNTDNAEAQRYDQSVNVHANTGWRTLTLAAAGTSGADTSAWFNIRGNLKTLEFYTYTLPPVTAQDSIDMSIIFEIAPQVSDTLKPVRFDSTAAITDSLPFFQTFDLTFVAYYRFIVVAVTGQDETGAPTTTIKHLAHQGQ